MAAIHGTLFRLAAFLLVLIFVVLGAPATSRAALIEPTSAPDEVMASPWIPAASPIGSTNSMTEIDDLTDWYVKGICFANDPFGYGFIKGGPEAAWHESTGTDLTYLDHAFYTFTGTSWGDEDTNNWAWWAPRLPNDGRWQVEAFIPAVDTGRANTSAARYRIWTGSAWQYSSVSQAANRKRWVSLGTFNFTRTTDPVVCGMGGPYVELRDVTTDGSSQPTILFDAIRWVEPTSPQPVTVNAYLPDIQEGSTVNMGTEVRICYEVSRPVDIRWQYCQEEIGGNPDCRVLVEGTGSGACLKMHTNPPGGKRTSRIEANEDGWVVAEDDASFYVRESSSNPRVDIRIDGGCNQTFDWGARFTYTYQSSVQGHIQVYDCWSGPAPDCQYLQQADVAPGEVRSGSYIGRVQPGPHWLEARLTTLGVTGRCDYTLTDRAPATPTSPSEPGATPLPTLTPLPTQTPPPSSTPIPTPRWAAVIVPGYGNSLPFTSGRTLDKLYPSELDTLESDLRKHMPALTCYYDWTESNEQSAKLLRTCIQLLRQQAKLVPLKIALITWSDGGLVARSLLQGDNPPQDIQLLVMIAPPNHGVVDMYPVWAGGHIKSLPTKLSIFMEAVYALYTGCADPLIGDSPVITRCRYDFNREKVRSVGELVPVGDEKFLVVEKDGIPQMLGEFDMHVLDQNGWLRRLNNDANRLRDAVHGDIVIVRGEGFETAAQVRVNGDHQSDPLWRDGALISIARNTSGDGLIRMGRAALNDYTVLTYRDDHTKIIATAEQEVVFPKMGLPPKQVMTHRLQSVAQDAPGGILIVGTTT